MIRIKHNGRLISEWDKELDIYKWIELHLGSGRFVIVDSSDTPVSIEDAIYLKDKDFEVRSIVNDPVSILINIAVSLALSFLASLFTKKPKKGRSTVPQTGTLSPYQNSAKPNDKIPICLGYGYVVPDVAASQFIDYIPSATITSGEVSDLSLIHI